MINYIVQVLLFQTVFLAIYDLILKRETFFQWNRGYLIFTSVLAYIIPLIKFETVSEKIPREYLVIFPEVMLSPTTYIEKQFDWSVLLFASLRWIFLIGIVFTALLFMHKLVQIIKLISISDSERKKDYSLVFLKKENTAFSFFRYIFLGKTAHQKDNIIKHELIHVKQKHSLDLLFFELQKIVFWFNPYSYLYQSRIAEVHEFIADSKTINQKDKTTYFQNMLAETFQVDKLAFVNSFNKSTLIKKRIMMLAKKNSKEILKLKYLLIIPVLMGMLVYSSCENNESEKALLKVNEKRFTKLVLGEYKNGDGAFLKERILQGKVEGYFDHYIGAKPDGKEIILQDLTSDEKLEYENFTERYKLMENGEFHSFKIFEMENGNRAIQEITDWKGLKKSWKSEDYSNADVVPFGAIDQVPVYPGCEDGEDQKTCLVQKITEHINANFDTSITKDLGLDPGKKRVYVQFKIDKTGNVVDIRARGPHKDLEEEALRVVSSLPKMQPGEENGKKVSVKYTLPITFVVD